MSAVTFTVLGHPEPAGSKRAFAIRRGGQLTGKVSVSDANPKGKVWQAEVRHAAAAALGPQLGDLLIGPLELTLRFYVQRPRGHYGTGRNEAKLKASAPLHPVVKPDVLKLARGVEDALSGIVYGDDAQIVDEHLVKRYGTPERCEVTVRPLKDPPA